MTAQLELAPGRSARPGRRHAARHAAPRVPGPEPSHHPVGRRADIQGLRALAVMLVIAAHAGIGHLSGGFIGVDVFFVISGFLITSLLLREAERTGTVSLRQFYSRRARRILPAATVVLVFVLADVALTQSARQLTTAFHDAGWSAIFLANVHFARAGANYFADHTPSPLQHYWSLSVEEQFYVVWPLLVGVLSRRLTRRALTAVFGGVLLASVIWSIDVTAAHPAQAYFSTPARTFELAAGAYLAIVLPRWPRLPSDHQRRMLGLVGIAAIVGAALSLRSNAPFPGWQALIPVVGTVLLLAGGTGAPVGVSQALGSRPLRYIGDLSYSLYLWHWPILRLGHHWLPSSWPHTFRLCLLLALTFVVSAASFRLIEQPFLQSRVPLSRGYWSLVLWPVALTSVLLAGTMGNAYTGHRQSVAKAAAIKWFKQHPASAISGITPDPGIHSPDVARINTAIGEALALAKQGAPVPPSLDTAALPSNNWHRKFRCVASWGDVTTPICEYGDTASATTVAVVGDSHAGHWLPSLDIIAKQEHVKLVPIVKMGCSPFDVEQSYSEMPGAECNSFRSWSREQLASLHPDVIIASSRAELWMTSRSGASIDQQWSKGVRTGVTALTRLAPIVKVFSDIPHRQNAVDCLTAPNAVQEDCIASTSMLGSSANPLTKEATTAAGATYVDVVPLACHAGRCPEVVGNLPVYYDDSHLSLPWGQHIAGALGELLGNLNTSG